MIKRMAVVLALVAGKAYGTMDCGLYYSYGTAQYAECMNRNTQEIMGQRQDSLNRYIDQSNAQMAQEKQAAQQADADIQLQQALRQIQQGQNR